MGAADVDGGHRGFKKVLEERLGERRAVVGWHGGPPWCVWLMGGLGNCSGLGVGAGVLGWVGGADLRTDRVV